MELLHSTWHFPEWEECLLDRCTLIEPFNIDESKGADSQMWAFLYGLNGQQSHQAPFIKLYFVLYGAKIFRSKDLAEVLEYIQVLRKNFIFDFVMHDNITNPKNA